MSKEENHVYDGLRHTLLLLGLDKGNFGSARWNPLKDIVGSGDTVVIKLNFVLSNHDEGGDLFSIITHSSVIRAVVDYVYIALRGEGNGPLTPDSKKCGLIIAGFNPCAVDLVCTRLMGFDCKRVKTLSYILTHSELFNPTSACGGGKPHRMDIKFSIR